MTTVKAAWRSNDGLGSMSIRNGYAVVYLEIYGNGVAGYAKNESMRGETRGDMIYMFGIQKMDQFYCFLSLLPSVIKGTYFKLNDETICILNRLYEIMLHELPCYISRRTGNR